MHDQGILTAMRRGVIMFLGNVNIHICATTYSRYKFMLPCLVGLRLALDRKKPSHMILHSLIG